MITRIKNAKSLRQLTRLENKISSKQEDIAYRRQYLKLSNQKKNEFFETPPAVWEFLFKHIPFYNYPQQVLDPCSGLGSFEDYVMEHEPYIEVVSVELNIEFWEFQRKVLGRKCKNGDFLKLWIPFKVDTIVMNPPFTKLNLFEKEGAELLKHGGRLLTICPVNYQSVLEDVSEIKIPRELTPDFPCECKIIEYRK